MPMVLGINIDFVTRKIAVGALQRNGGRSSPTAIAFGLAFATILTLIVTPSALMLKANVGTWRVRRRGLREGAAVAGAAE